MDEHAFWYMTRSAGFVAYLLLFASVVFGLTMTTSFIQRLVPRYRVYDLHRFLSLLTLSVTVFHVLIVLPDGFFGFTLRELLVPFASPYEPFFMGLGSFSLYFMAIAIGAFYLRPLVSYSLWRTLHYTTFAVFVLAVVHGVGAGTDTGATWATWLYAVTGLVVFNLVVWRVFWGRSHGIVSKPAETPAPQRSAGIAPSAEFADNL
ncbi:MAG TPA: ferric reductase-like transmembrane domain-containing protein [Dehalococcoidia bacterium]|nr:ferric reductase-like transmembrane domain-containing protein [Dehalococcoidia bacterium]